MLWQLAEIFVNVITPVFALVLIGYVTGPRLALEARTLSRFAYFLLVPAFVFNIMSTAEVEASSALRMIGFILLVQVSCALLGLVVARLLGHGPEMVAAYMLVAVFANVGNFGLPLIEFRLGPEALVAATLYFVVILASGFVIGVAVASWNRDGGWKALLALFKTPALLALVPALLLNGANVAPPLFLARVTGLLGGAMVPTMLVTLGVQLAATGQIQVDRDVLVASAVRLLGGAGIALLLAAPFGLEGIERGAGIFQAAMPAAILTSIIALEYNLRPAFVTTTVLVSTLASVVTLTLLFAFV